MDVANFVVGNVAIVNAMIFVVGCNVVGQVVVCTVACWLRCWLLIMLLVVVNVADSFW